MMCVCAHLHRSTRMEVRRQLTRVLPFREPWGWNSGDEASWQGPLPTEPSLQPQVCFIVNFNQRS